MLVQIQYLSRLPDTRTELDAFIGQVMAAITQSNAWNEDALAGVTTTTNRLLASNLRSQDEA
jgi:hypothetical protein